MTCSWEYDESPQMHSPSISFMPRDDTVVLDKWFSAAVDAMQRPLLHNSNTRWEGTLWRPFISKNDALMHVTSHDFAQRVCLGFYEDSVDLCLYRILWYAYLGNYCRRNSSTSNTLTNPKSKDTIYCTSDLPPFSASDRDIRRPSVVIAAMVWMSRSTWG